MTQPMTLTVARKAPRLTLTLGIVITAMLLAMPFLALLPADHPLALSAYTLTLTGKILCYAIVAVALDLVWGYAGLLSLGHGLFFALGGYAMGMYLMRQAAGDGLPAFMSFLSWHELPWFWVGTQHFAWALLLIMLVPGLLALLFGFFAFRSKIKGVYFSIMTQALTYAGMLLFFRNETGFAATTALPALPPCSASRLAPSARASACLSPPCCCCWPAWRSALHWRAASLVACLPRCVMRKTG
jgi:urea transport system permease protein